MARLSKEKIKSIIHDYKTNIKVSVIVKKYNLYDQSHLYKILKRYKVPKRTKKVGGNPSNISDGSDLKRILREFNNLN